MVSVSVDVSVAAAFKAAVFLSGGEGCMAALKAAATKAAATKAAAAKAATEGAETS